MSLPEVARAHHAAELARDDRERVADALRFCAELKASRRRARQADGIAKARAAGAYKGRRPSIDREAIRRMHAEGLSPAEIARCVGCGRASVYRVLSAEDEKTTR